MPTVETPTKPYLTDRQKSFVEHYCGSLNGLRSAIAAGYSERNARQTAHELRQNPVIQEEIRKTLSGRSLTSGEVVERLSQQARNEVAEFIDINSTGLPYVDFEALKAAGKMHLIKSIKPTKEGLTVEFFDAQAALVHLGKYHQIFIDKSEVTHEVSLDAVLGAIPAELRGVVGAEIHRALRSGGGVSGSEEGDASEAVSFDDPD